MFEIVEKEPIGTIIKVVGIGGAGGNAVDHMIRESVHGVEFITANTDAQALKRNLSSQKVQLGTSGLGAGAKPEAGRCSAQEAREQIAEAITCCSLPPAWAVAPAPVLRRWWLKWPRKWASSPWVW
jgi:cell division protein FtsZ